eukprot:snap_masked-scaffold_12-processed-gene-5.57-mRNA-1 protein AED:1.00 eAED:1.00 QI:0/-1/0/0/-1/1/1/0/62
MLSDQNKTEEKSLQHPISNSGHILSKLKFKYQKINSDLIEVYSFCHVSGLKPAEFYISGYKE